MYNTHWERVRTYGTDGMSCIMLMQMSHPLVAPETKIRWRGARGVCLLIRNETVYRKQQYEKKIKDIPKSENRLHPPVYCFALTFNNNNSLLFYFIFFHPFLFHTYPLYYWYCAPVLDDYYRQRVTPKSLCTSCLHMKGQ